MNILYISNSIIPSRTANSIHVMKMCQAFADNGHKVILLAPDKKNKNKKEVDVYEYYGVKKNFIIKKLWYPNLKGRSIFYSLAILFYLISNKKFDLVYGRFLFGCYLSVLLQNNVIFEVHDPIYKRGNFELKIFKKLVNYKKFVKLVVISDVLKNIYLKSGFLNQNQIQVAHDGADEVMDFANKIHLFGNKKNLKVGYLGSLYKGKGIEVIYLLANKVSENIEFHIVGGNDKEIEYWRSRIDSKNVFFYGFVPHKKISSYINSMDICLLPNQKKLILDGVGDISSFTSPLKLFEYMSHKKTIIASNIKVLKEILNQKNSILVDPDNINEWSQALEKLKDPHNREKISNQALIDFAPYTWKNRVKKILIEK